MKILMLFLASLISYTTGGLQKCCHFTRSKECNKNCMSLVTPHIKNFEDYFTFPYMNNKLIGIVDQCPRSETRFWDCLHDTELWKNFRIKKTKRRHRSRHGICCKQAKHISCEVDCLTNSNMSKLLKNENCNARREPKMSQCIVNVRAAKRCCYTKNRDCKHACMKYLKNTRSDLVLKRRSDLQKKCGLKSKQYKCAIHESRYDTAIQDVTRCCKKGINRKCVDTCKNSLHNLETSFSKFFGSLRGDCGELKIETPLYKCIMENSAKNPKRTLPSETRTQKMTFPSFKEQCCARAKSSTCHNWCKGTISSPTLMGLWDSMYLTCIENPKEIELSNCMLDILEPCKIGVKEPMSFCTNFNHRPLDLFRRGNKYGDSAARKLHKFWNDSLVEISDYSLSFKNVFQCKPDMFKAMACLIAVKPCNHRLSQRQFCRRDCEELLNACLDKGKKKHGEISVHDVCATVLPNPDQSNCISVKDYTDMNSKFGEMSRDEVTMPCEKNPCAADEMCIINQECQPNSVVPCQKYKCEKGCPVVGQKLLIPKNQLAKLTKSGSKPECYHICKCRPMKGNGGAVFVHGDCIDFGCNHRKNCTHKGTIYTDGMIFEDSCNTCTCTDGSLICTDKKCIIGSNGRLRRHHSNGQLIDVTITTAPCNCHNVYNPVCSRNGMTYPNSCVAKCFHMADLNLRLGDCPSINPCIPDQCALGYKCIARRQLCLPPRKDCPQYICSPKKTPGKKESKTFESCMENESKKELKVCGFDGVNYASRCHAEDMGTGVDYKGACLPDKYEKLDLTVDRCKVVKCEKIDDSVCILFTPPGACCPVCGSMLRTLYSHNDLINHRNFVNLDAITVGDIVKRLRELLEVAECKLYGHLTVENDLLIIITVNSLKPTRGQIHACRTEAERFHKYINQRSPRVTTNYYLSLLKASKLKTAKYIQLKSSACTNNNGSYTVFFLLTFISLLHLSLTR